MPNCLHVSETSAPQKKVFWRKVLEIYATSIDYDPHAESSVLFFKQVQNKMHWAAHKHTAAEVIYERADAEKENMGLTSWEHNEIRRSDVEVANNNLTEQELDALNKIVTAYLDIAEVHALNKEPMYMKDWLETIDDYLKMTRRDILTSSGHISHKQAIEKAHAEYDKYKNLWFTLNYDFLNLTFGLCKNSPIRTGIFL